MKKLLAGVVFTGLALVPSVANATSILPNCGTCGNHNTAWDLTYTLVNDAENIYQFTVTATYGSTVDFVYVNSIAFKFDSFPQNSNYDSTPTLNGAPPEDSWSVVTGGISNSSGTGDCDGTGNGFWCAKSLGNGATHGAGGTTDTWVFTLNLNNALANLGTTTTGTFKAGFGDINGNKFGSLLSEEGVTFGPPPPSVPEPASLLLFGTGLAAVATAFRRHRRKQ
jgi:hypothetical protein